MTRTKEIFITTLSVMLILGMGLTPHVIAEEISVTDNGANSSSSVRISSTQQTNTQQSNNAQITNTISTTSSTGDNSASNTNGEATIQTGNATNTTDVNNAVNESVSNQPCCSNTQTAVTISNNGSGSNNSSSLSTTSHTTAGVNQNVTVINSLDQVLTTGKNKVKNNAGSVLLSTGNISNNVKLKNNEINLAHVVTTTSYNPLSFLIFGNGVGSNNSITHNENITNSTDITNAVNIINTLKTTYQTGENTVTANKGDVKIITGDITSFITILNEKINSNDVKVACKNDQDKHNNTNENNPVPVGGTTPPLSQTSPSGGSNPPSSVSEEVASVLAAATLPVTGNNLLALALFGNIMMLLLGAYLRLRSGRSPGFAFVV